MPEWMGQLGAAVIIVWAVTQVTVKAFDLVKSKNTQATSVEHRRRLEDAIVPLLQQQLDLIREVKVLDGRALEAIQMLTQRHDAVHEDMKALRNTNHNILGYSQRLLMLTEQTHGGVEELTRRPIR